MGDGDGFFLVISIRSMVIDPVFSMGQLGDVGMDLAGETTGDCGRA